MGTVKLTETERDMLAAAGEWAYCGYDPSILETAYTLEALGLGVVDESDLGPIFRPNAAGRAPLNPEPSHD